MARTRDRLLLHPRSGVAPHAWPCAMLVQTAAPRLMRSDEVERMHADGADEDVPRSQADEIDQMPAGDEGERPPLQQEQAAPTQEEANQPEAEVAHLIPGFVP